PDMKPIRVTVTCSIFVALVLAAFTIPLPVSRVQTEGIIELEYESMTPVPVRLAESGKAVLLTELYVKDGERVEEGQRLARFFNRDKDEEMRKAEKERKAYDEKIELLKLETNRAAVQEEINRTEILKAEAEVKYRKLREFIIENSVVRAPHAGIIMSPPSIDDVGKRWDKEKNPLLCIIGEPADSPDGERKLHVRVPVT